ncbi:MAG: histidinol-phosphatase [Deltaproteobacteria bacterium]|nr:MAG: histidinol-phosphatase [Deltaproteobacteria bacterium]
MAPLDLPAAARAAEAAADRARSETLSRFRAVDVETKADGSPVTEADRAAERSIRATLGDAYPDVAILGEEYGGRVAREGPCWVVDPIDGTIAFSRGIPLFSTLIALLEDGEPVLGLIDLPALGERLVGWRGGGCRRNGERVRVSRQADLGRALVSHGDPFCFDRAGQRPALERMLQEIPMLRGYTDAFGHSLVISGSVDAMVDFDCNLWDLAATQVLIPEAEGRLIHVPQANGKQGIAFGSPALVDQLAGFLERGA